VRCCAARVAALAARADVPHPVAVNFLAEQFGLLYGISEPALRLQQLRALAAACPSDGVPTLAWAGRYLSMTTVLRRSTATCPIALLD